MDNQLLNKTITVAEIKINQGNIKIVDGQGLTYTIWETKKNGDKTVAYQAYEGLGNIMGKTLEIGYSEKDMTTGSGKFRNIVTLKMVAGENMGVEQGNRPNQAQTGLKSPVSSQNDVKSPISPSENTYNQDKPKDEVQNHIRWCNSLNNASLIVAKIITEETYDRTIEKIEFLANMIYKLEPKEEGNYDKKPNMPSGNESWNQPDGQREDQAELRSEDIPF